MVDVGAGLLQVRRKETAESDFQRVLGFVFHRHVALLTETSLVGHVPFTSSSWVTAHVDFIY